MAELVGTHRSVSMSVSQGEQCSLTSSLQSEVQEAVGRLGSRWRELPYLAVSIQGPRELPSWCAWARVEDSAHPRSSASV